MIDDATFDGTNKTRDRALHLNVDEYLHEYHNQECAKLLCKILACIWRNPNNLHILNHNTCVLQKYFISALQVMVVVKQKIIDFFTSHGHERHKSW